jgi:hypothetical protein
MIRKVLADVNACALYLFLSVGHREAFYGDLRLADADVACRFGDARFTQGSDSASSLAGRGGRCRGRGRSVLGRMVVGDATGGEPGWLASQRRRGSASRAVSGGLGPRFERFLRETRGVLHTKRCTTS